MTIHESSHLDARVQDHLLLSSEEPLLMFERISKRLGLKKWYLFPIPLVALYAVTSLIPHVYSLYMDVPWKIYYVNFETTFGWFILITVVLYGTVIFRRKYYSEIRKLVRDGIIEPAQLSKTNLFHGKVVLGYIGLWILFELLVGFFWYYDLDPSGRVVRSASTIFPQIPGTVIMLFVLPVAAEVFTVAFVGALLPFRLADHIRVKPLHLDQHGGLKPFGNIMLIIEYVYVGGIVFSVAAFAEFRSTPILWLLFISIMTTLILAPQKVLHDKLSKAKDLAQEAIQQVYFRSPDEGPDEYNVLPRRSGSIEKTWPLDVAYLAYVKMAKEQIESMKTWSFDIVRLYKLATLFISIPFISAYLQQIVRL